MDSIKNKKGGWNISAQIEFHRKETAISVLQIIA